MANSPDTFPPGWGFGTLRASRIVIRAKRYPSPPEPATRPRATRERANDDRRLHMRFALWAVAIETSRNSALYPSDVITQFGVSYETARRWLADWKRLKETQA